MNKKQLGFLLAFGALCALVFAGIFQRLPEVRQILAPITCQGGEIRVSGQALECIANDRVTDIRLINFAVVWIIVDIMIGGFFMLLYVRQRSVEEPPIPKQVVPTYPPNKLPPATPKPADIPALSPAEAEFEMHRHLAQGKKIQAIKVVRAATNWGLKDSKDFVDRIIAGENVRLPGTDKEPQQDEIVESVSLDQETEFMVRDLLWDGKKIQAIKVVRGVTGWELKETKEYIDQIENELMSPALPNDQEPQISPSGQNRPTDGAEREMYKFLSENKKISAIKVIREATNWSLKDSKDYVDRAAAGQQVPPLPVSNSIDAAKVDANKDLSEADREIRRLLLRGKKIDAIKIVREKTQWGLKEAKTYIDLLVSDQKVPPLSEMSNFEPFPQVSTTVEEEVRALMAAGQKIKAIKMLRAETGMGLREAKEYVENL